MQLLLMVTIQEAVDMFRKEYLRRSGVVGVSTDGRAIIVYIEDERVKAILPYVYHGFPVIPKVVGGVTTL